MSHFAEIENGIVKRVIVAEQDFIDSGVVGNPDNWVQTSYNTHGGVNIRSTPENPVPALRKNYAGIGFTYDSVRDAFIEPKPYDSWVLNEETCQWEAPTKKPEGRYDWDEKLLEWIPRE